MIKIVYTIFLGILLALFVGITVSTFYPAPKYPDHPKSIESQPHVSGQVPAPTAEETAQAKADREEYDRQQDEFQTASNVYNRNVFAIILACSIIMLVISLSFMKQIPIIADGVLLGGALTLLYAIARGLMSEDGIVRFVVVLVGLIIALILGYIKFIHPDKKATG